MRFVATMLGVLMLGGCGLFGGGGPDPVRWEATLQGQPGFTEVSGAASASALNGETTANVELRGVPAGSQLPWHIHLGTCGSGGNIVGPPAAYPALIRGNDPTTRAQANINLELTRGAAYHVNVHRSTQELGTVIACGNLVAE